MRTEEHDLTLDPVAQRRGARGRRGRRQQQPSELYEARRFGLTGPYK
jgi:hypothetical protein